MIRLHEFNSAWWGADTGIVDDARFFELPAKERDALLRPYAWAEYLATAPDPRQYPRMHAAGFVFGDAQVHFSIELKPLAAEPLPRGLSFHSAAKHPFDVDPREVQVFEGERFFALPGVTGDRVAERYALWARRLADESPSTCLRAEQDGVTQGWFLGKPEGKPERSGLALTLAMLSRHATVQGMAFYAAALAEYGRAGHRMGAASYSYRNTGVAYMLASLGARVTGVRETWMWVPQ